MSERPLAAARGDVPELDMPARPSKAQLAAKAQPPPQGPPDDQRLAPPMIPSMPGDIEDDDPGASLKLDLDFSKGPPPNSTPSAPTGQTSAQTQAQASSPGGVTANVAPIRGSQAGGAPLVRAEPRGDSGTLDPYEVRALADYGEPPEEWWRTPLYAYRVLRRRPELKKLAWVKSRDAERARGAADDALSAFAELARPAAEKLGAYASALDHVRATEQVLRERDAVLAAEADAHKHRAAQFEAKLAELEAQVAQIQIEERNVTGEATESDALLKRAEARVKRAEIEIRNALVEAGVAPPTSASKGGP